MLLFKKRSKIIKLSNISAVLPIFLQDYLSISVESLDID